MSISISQRTSRPADPRFSFRHPPLAGDAFVNQRLAVGGEGGDLSFDAGNDLLRFGNLGVQKSADGLLLFAGRLKGRQVAGLHLVENRKCRRGRDAGNHILINLELVGEEGACIR